MGMRDMLLRQCTEEKEQLERSLEDIDTIISLLEKGVKQYPENIAYELSNFYRYTLKEAESGKKVCEKRIAELGEKIAQLNG